MNSTYTTPNLTLWAAAWAAWALWLWWWLSALALWLLSTHALWLLSTHALWLLLAHALWLLLSAHALWLLLSAHALWLLLSAHALWLWWCLMAWVAAASAAWAQRPNLQRYRRCTPCPAKRTEKLQHR